MKKIGDLLKREDGIALILAIGTILIMIIIGTVILMNVRNSSSTVFHDREQTQAVNVADAGIDNAIATMIANYGYYFPGGVVPSPPTNSPDGKPVYDSDQQITDQNGNVTGTYQAWYKQDPNINGDPNLNGNVLITAQGTVNLNNNQFKTKVRVSVKYTAGAFDYAFLAGSQTNNNATTTFTATSGGDDDSSVGANMVFTGKFNVNGNLMLSSPANGQDDDDSAPRGTIDFQTRPGFTNPRDPVTVTGTYTPNTKPSGTQPVHATSYVQFPAVDFAKFTSLGSSKVITVNLDTNTCGTGGWTRNGNTFSINADTFQQTYGSYQVVRFTAAQSNTIVQIVGGCGSYIITPTLMMDEGTSGNVNTAPSELDIIGPGISLEPTNGVAILSNYGAVKLEADVTIGSSTAGALVYLGGQYGANSLTATGNLAMWGSLAVNGPVTFTTIGKGEEDDSDDNHGEHTKYCGGGNDDQHADAGHTTNMAVTYGSEYLTNTNLPDGWWTWTGGSGITALKYNYQRG